MAEAFATVSRGAGGCRPLSAGVGPEGAWLLRKGLSGAQRADGCRLQARRHRRGLLADTVKASATTLDASVNDAVKGRCVVVTGASRGLGVSIARAFACAGAASVCLVARSEETLQTTCAELRAEHPCISFFPLVADVTSSEDRTHLVAAVKASAAAAPLVLINNAGVEAWGPFEHATEASIDEQIAVNLAAPIHLSRAFLPEMLARGTGTIIHVASLAGKLGSPNSAAYTASKHGLVGFSRALRSEVAGRGVSSCVVCPSFVRTALLDSLVAKAGGAHPLWLSTTTTAAVAEACVRAVTDDEPEALVNSVPMRPILMLFEALPRLPQLVDAAFPWLFEFNRRCGRVTDQGDGRGRGSR